MFLKELSYLLPETRFDIQMYGNEVSKLADGVTFQHHNLHIHVVRGIYHKKCSTARKPHLVIGTIQE